ncbi:ribokinase [Nitratireductor sp. CAU 1489]|uniref:Ribokinase n=1 Tax=Nitratireductor arenosus TaxID=2682096 RepID=A0A844QFX1_9HYPH|nr:ribokinase [Nitratireductor arenosus]MVA96881.1 ribokinase [Nitratireductor arenosus]
MVIVIGSINLDLIATVGRLPGPGETVAGDTFSNTPGGKGANQALAAARAGAAVRMVGAVGKDAFAAEALALLDRGGVDLTGVGETHASTGTALILVGADGENMIAVVAGANAAVLPGDVTKAALDAGDVVLMQQEIPLDTIRAALQAARAAGAVSVLNTAPYSDEAVDLPALADYVVANETEFDLCARALGLGGDGREARMRDFVATTGRTVVVTLGGEGVLAASPDGFYRVAALAVTPVDTVGAGDTFCGYLGAALERGEALEAALRRAAVAGSLACLKPGAQPAIPLAEDVEARR